MDETAVYFELNHKQTLTYKGENHVGIVSDGKERQKVTVILTIGYTPYRTNYAIKKLPPIIIFRKAKPKGYIGDHPKSDLLEDEALQNLAKSEGALLLQSFSGWNNEHLMSKYFVPHTRKNIPHQIPALLLMDNFPAHGTDSVVEGLKKIRSNIFSCHPIAHQSFNLWM